MHKNESLYYCYLPNTKSEMVIRVPMALGEDVEGAHSCLYEKDKPLGQTFFETLGLITVALPIDDKQAVHVITDEAIHDCFERMKDEPSQGKNLLKEYLGSIRRAPEKVDCLYDEISAYKDLAERFLYAEVPCEKDDFELFCRKLRGRIDRGTIVQLELEEFLEGVQMDQTPQVILDFLLRTFVVELEEKREIQQRVEPYMYDYYDFSMALKERLLEYASTSELIITVHVYKLNSLYDLFSATMVETINRKKFVNKKLRDYNDMGFKTPHMIIQELIDGNSQYEYPMLYTPYYVDARMSAQSSYFMMWGTNEKPLEDMLSSDDLKMKLPEKENGIRMYGEHEVTALIFRFFIHADRKQPILHELDTVGINEKTLFPGLDGIGRYIERKYRFDYNEALGNI